MQEELKNANSGEPQLAAGPAGLDADEYLSQHYRLRRNVLSGKVEFRLIDEDDSLYRPLATEELNSIILRSRRDGYTDKTDISGDLKLLVASADIPKFDPVRDWLKGLVWDGKERLVDFWQRIPGVTSEQIYLFTIWHRSMVAHWLGKDDEHGNECVPTLIGFQGCGKSTFCRKMLPPHLRQYYMDNFYLGNKFDKDMALTNSLLINLDEMDQYKSGQQAQLKQAMSKVRVNGRKIFGRTQEDRQRYASFISTTNNQHPLQDTTGSRRNICVQIPAGMYIDNVTEIEYEQIYAQLMHEVENGERYWFNNDETIRIQELNAPFMRTADVEMMIDATLTNEDTSELISTKDVVAELIRRYPNADEKKLTRTKIGRTMVGLGFEKRHMRNGEFFIASFKASA